MMQKKKRKKREREKKKEEVIIFDLEMVVSEIHVLTWLYSASHNWAIGIANSIHTHVDGW